MANVESRFPGRGRVLGDGTILLTDLPADMLQKVVHSIQLAHHMALAAPTCRVVSVAVLNAFKARPFSGEAVTLAPKHTNMIGDVAAAPDGRIVTAAHDRTVRVWTGGTCVNTIRAHTESIPAVAVLPDGAFVSGSEDCTAKLWSRDGVLERTFAVGSHVDCIEALPDGVHFVVGLGWANRDNRGPNVGDIRLYHIDGTLVHTFKHTNFNSALALAVTRDGQHIISGCGYCGDDFVNVWSIATLSLVSTCAGHTNGVRVVAAMPDSQRILSAGGESDTAVRVWLLNGTLENIFTLHDKSYHATGAVNALVALPDNQHALTGAADTTCSVKLFNVNDGSVLRNIKILAHPQRYFDRLETACVTGLALLPDGLRVVVVNFSDARIVYHGLAL